MKYLLGLFILLVGCSSTRQENDLVNNNFDGTWAGHYSSNNWSETFVYGDLVFDIENDNKLLVNDSIYRRWRNCGRKSRR